MVGKLVACLVALVVLGQREALAKGNIQRMQMLDAEAEESAFGDRAVLVAATHVSKKNQHRIDELSKHPSPLDAGTTDEAAFGESFIPKPIIAGKGNFDAALSAATRPLPKQKLAEMEEIAGNPHHASFLKGLEEAYHTVDPSHHIPEAVVATSENGYGIAQYGSAQHTPHALYVVTNDTSYAKVYQILLGGFGALVVLSMIRVWFLRATGDGKMQKYSDTNGYVSADLNDDPDQYDNVKDDNSLSSSYLLAGRSRSTRADDLLYNGSYGAVI